MAIGDGANDVSMILEAHVGIGKPLGSTLLPLAVTGVCPSAGPRGHRKGRTIGFRHTFRARL